MSPRNKLFLLAGAGAALAAAIPALGQDRPESILPPGFGEQPAPQPRPSQPSRPAPPAQPSPATGGGTVVETTPEAVAAEVAAAEQPAPVQIELPSASRRDPGEVGPLPGGSSGFGEAPWGSSSGKFLSILMRRTDTPLASRWGHIALRNLLLTRATAPADVAPGDWVAERAWLLLRMGEADAARLLVSGIDVDDFTPKLFQVAVQSALANADPAALCPLSDGLNKVEKKADRLVDAMCASLSGNSEVAAAGIESARRSGRYTPIDLALADKVVGAGADTGRAVTVEWEPVERVTAWRYGLATATGIALPEKLVAKAPPRVRAWQARAPILSVQQRIDSARIATGLGVFSSQALIDLYAQQYDSTDPSDLGGTDAWQLRQAMVGNDREARLAAIRKLLDGANDPLQRMAAHALVARAAALVEPDSELEDVAPDLIAAMLAAGNDRGAARWSQAIEGMDGDVRDRCWAMLALGAPQFPIDSGRLDSFIVSDESPGKHRSGLLVAGLAGLGRITVDRAARLNSRYDLGLGGRTEWTSTIDGASQRRQSGTVMVLAAVGLQAPTFAQVPALHQYHLVTALHRNGVDFVARMIAAEALART